MINDNVNDNEYDNEDMAHEHLKSSSKAVRQFIFEQAKTICDNVFDTTRPSATDRMEQFIVVALKNKIPHSSITDKAWIQFHVYVRDGAKGIFRDEAMQEMIDAVKGLDLKTPLFALNGGEPYETDPKTDGLGFHAVAIQYSVTLIRE